MIRSTAALLFLLTCAASVLAQQQSAEEPNLKVETAARQVFMGRNTGGFTLQGTLGALQMEWKHIARVEVRKGTVIVYQTDGSRLTGTVKEAAITLNGSDGSAQEVKWADVVTVTVDRALPPRPKPAGLEVKVIQRGLTLACAGLASAPDGAPVLLDRSNPAVVWIDPATLKEKRRAALGREPLCVAPVPGGRQILVAFSGSVAWLDAETGAKLASVTIPIDAHSIAAPTDDLAAASDGKTLVVASKKAGSVKAKDEGLEVLLMPLAKPDVLFSTKGPVILDLDAAEKGRRALWTIGDEGGQQSDSCFLRGDCAIAVTSSGIVARPGRGAYASWVILGRVPLNATGYFTPGGESVVLFGTRGGVTVVRTSDWKTERELAFPFLVSRVLPSDGGAVVVGRRGDPGGGSPPSSQATGFRDSEVWKIRLEE